MEHIVANQRPAPHPLQQHHRQMIEANQAAHSSSPINTSAATCASSAGSGHCKLDAGAPNNSPLQRCELHHNQRHSHRQRQLHIQQRHTPTQDTSIAAKQTICQPIIAVSHRKPAPETDTQSESRSRTSSQAASLQQRNQLKSKQDIKTSLDASIQLIEATHKYTALRQINIVGQLNHWAKSGTLFIMNLIVLMALVCMLTVELRATRADAAIWPFGASAGASGYGHSKIALANVSSWATPFASMRANGLMSGVRRATRSSGQVNSGDADLNHSGFVSAAEQNSTPAMSQQYHYFWNHDQIEPKLVANEAQRILTEAQLQTNQAAGGSGSASGTQQEHHESNLNRQDSMMTASSAPTSLSMSGVGASMILSPAIQQQLTSMVLQMQRQQQMSMMMQPRFDAARRMDAVGQQLPITGAPMPHINPMSRYLLSGSSQHPVIAPPPMGASESAQVPTMSVPFAPGALLGAPPRTPHPIMASVGGVPVYGPFMVSPSIAAPLFQHAAMSAAINRNTHLSGAANSKSAPIKPATSRFATSFLSRRKSWPLFGGSNLVDHTAGALHASGSQVQPTVISPPAGPQTIAYNLVPEAVALLDMTSKQLANVIAGQLQAVDMAVRQKFAAAAMGQNLDGQFTGDMHSSASVPTIHHVTKPNHPFTAAMSGQRSLHLPPPYLIPASYYDPTQLAMSLAQQPLLNYSHQPDQNFDQSAYAVNGSSLPFGSRLKRRHLHALQTSTHSRPINNNPVSISIAMSQAKIMSSPPYNMKETNVVVNGQSSNSKKRVANTMMMNNGNKFSVEAPPDDQFTTQTQLGANDTLKPFVTIYDDAGPRSMDMHHYNTISNSNNKSFQARTYHKPSTNSETKRIVKKDKPIADTTVKSTKATDKKSKSELHRLFLLMATESPLGAKSLSEDMFEVDDDEKPTQLRRLKRSLQTFEPLLTERVARLSRSVESSWKSIGGSEITPDDQSRKYIPLNKFVDSATKSASADIWTPAQARWSSGGQAAAITVSKRHSDISGQASGAEGLKQSIDINRTSPVVETVIGGQQQETTKTPAFKIKRITASVSVIHHPVSKFQDKPNENSLKKGSIISGAPSSLKTVSIQPGEVMTKFVNPQQDTSIDPMSASVSESARVVNYFQNIENETTSTTRPPQQQQQQQQQQQSQFTQSSGTTSQGSPQLNVGYPPPTKIIVQAPLRLNETGIQNQDSGDDLRRQTSHQHQQIVSQPIGFSGNVRTNRGQPVQVQQLPQLGPSASGSSGASNAAQNGFVSKSRTIQLQQLPAAALSADISSAATGNRAYMSSLAPPSGSPVTAESLKSQRTNIMHLLGKHMLNNKIDQLRSSTVSPLNVNFQSTLISSLLDLADQNKRRISTQNPRLLPMFKSISHSQQQQQAQQQQQYSSSPSPLSSNTLINTSSSNRMLPNSSSDKSSSADQSNNFNEEVMPPQSHQSALSEQNMLNSQSANPESLGPGQTDQVQPFSSIESANEQLQQMSRTQVGSSSQDQSSGNVGGYIENNLGTRNTPTNPAEFNANTASEQMPTDFTKYNQQMQELHSQSNPPSQQILNSLNQTDTFVTETPVDPSTFNQNELFNQFNNQLAQQPITEEPQLSGSQSGQPVMSPMHEQMFSQQLQALKAAMSNLNQQRYNQQIDTTPTLGPQRNYFEQPTSYPQPHPMMYTVDEESAANTAAAAGIPTLPTAAQLMAIQNHRDYGGMLMFGSEKRNENDDDTSSNSSGKSNKKPKKKGYKQVSHHYHFNSLMSPLEDGSLDTQVGPFNPLEIAGNLQHAENLKAAQQMREKNKKEEEKVEEAEEEKPKKKGFLRRFSLKNLFKRFRKDKNKDNGANKDSNEKNNSSNNESSSER